MISVSGENAAVHFVSSVRHRRIRLSQGRDLARGLLVSPASLDKAESFVPFGVWDYWSHQTFAGDYESHRRRLAAKILNLDHRAGPSPRDY
jgi:predicted oxidoreductase